MSLLVEYSTDLNWLSSTLYINEIFLLFSTIPYAEKLHLIKQLQKNWILKVLPGEHEDLGVSV